MSSSQYLEVLKASYDYEPQSEDEIAIKEDQILLLLEKSDDEWWKVKIKDSSDEGEGGLVPAAYVEPANHTSVVKALYDYDAGAPGELSVKEDEELLVFDKDEDWLLVKTQTGGHVGYVPGNYVEETAAEQSAASEPEPEPAPAPAFPRIVIPSSPKLAPQPEYVDPADRVAASKAKANADSIQTWSVSEVDKKGKKKKGTLGIGNGAVFFTSESDKAPVQKWQTTAIESVRIEKNKHVHIDIGGDSTTSLHFNAGSKDAAEAIVGKLKSSAQTNGSTPSRTTSPAADADEERKPNKNGASVRFASSPHSIIPPREPSIDEDEQNVQPESQSGADAESGLATVLYDFTADGDDELTVHEGEKLTVLDQDSDEWWKCENSRGQIGVVPASYVELAGGSQPTTNGVTHLEDVEEEEAQEDEDDSAAREEEERNAKAAAAERERQRREVEAEERAQAEARARLERKAKAKAAAEAAEADRKRREREAEEKAEADTRARMERESAERKRAQQLKKQAADAASQRPSSSASQEPKSRPSSDARRGPPPKHTRVWHDRTGQFQVEAEFLGFNGGKLRLHKTNGVVIEVPAEKMSAEDLRFVEKWKKKSQAAAAAASAANDDSEDDQPLGNIRKPKQSEPAKESEARRKAPVKKAPTTDWFEFFLSAGCDVDDCTRYATSFERDKIDETILSDITDQTMRSLGLREGDIIRVKKAIASRTGQPPKPDNSAAIQAQLARDEELARQLQAEEGDGHAKPRRQTTSPAPNLFSNGPGGQLNVRRGRPQPTKSTPPISVDLQSITSASEQLTGGRGSPATLTTSPVQAPPRASSAAASSNTSGFDDDAWTPRPSSTKPMTPTPAAANARPPSAPPAPAAPAPVPTPTSTAAAPTATAAPSQTAQPQTQTASGGSLARTTENDVFEQLARLSALQTRNPAAASPLGNTRTTSAPAAPSPAAPPVSFQHGLGMGPSPVPIGQHMQTQNTQFQSQQTGAPRGPFAPVPANTSLLQPLIPTTTGFSGFMPTRPASNPPFQPPQPQPQPMPLQTPFLNSQPTGFPGLMRPQSTGFPVTGSLASQPTGFPVFGGGQGFGGNPAFGQLQTQPTGFPSNPNMNFGYNNSAFNSPPPVPPVPPLPSSTTNTVTPANIFAQMKSGTFGSDDAPQSADKYDALRPQPTGWGGFGANMNVYQNGYTGYGR